MNLRLQVRPQHVLRDDVGDALGDFFDIDQPEAFLGQDFVDGGDAQNAIDADV